MALYLVHLNDPTKKKLFKKLLGHLDFIAEVKEIKGSAKSKKVKELMEAIKEVKRHEAGEINLRNAKDFLKEL